MASEHEADWIRARDQFIKPYLEKHPKGQYADQAQAFLDRMEMDKYEKVLRNHAKFGQEPKSEPERLYVAASKFELFGDTITALEKYEGMVQLLKDDKAPEARAFVNLARRQSAKIREQGGGQSIDRRKLIEASLKKADDLYQNRGDLLEARKVWESIIKLYGGNRELAPLVRRASAKLNNPDANFEPEEPDGTTKPPSAESGTPPAQSSTTTGPGPKP